MGGIWESQVGARLFIPTEGATFSPLLSVETTREPGLLAPLDRQEQYPYSGWYQRKPIQGVRAFTTAHGWWDHSLHPMESTDSNEAPLSLLARQVPVEDWWKARIPRAPPRFQQKPRMGQRFPPSPDSDEVVSLPHSPFQGNVRESQLK